MAGPPSERPLLVRRAGRPMACDVSVQIAALPDQSAAAAVAADACMAWFDEVDTCLSRFRPESELSRLNQHAGSWVAASDTLFEAVACALSAAHASAGLFDPTLLRHLEALGYDRDFSLIERREIERHVPLPAAPGPPAWRAIALDHARRRIRLPAGAALDLGGIAKGWSADVALARYCAPFTGALVNVGGDLCVRGGPAPGEPWLVGLRDPRTELDSDGDGADDAAREPAYVAAVSLSRGGLATSGALRRWWLRAGQRQHHLLDPRTGRPVRLWIDARDGPPDAPDATAAAPLLATATALAPTAARAETAAKVALLRGHPQALRAVEDAWSRYGALGPDTDADVGVALALTLGSGEVVTSANLPAYLASWGTAGASLPVRIAASTDGAAKGE